MEGMGSQSSGKIKELMTQVESLLDQVHELCQQDGRETTDVIDEMMGEESSVPMMSEESSEDDMGDDDEKGKKKLLIIAALKKKNGMKGDEAY